MHFIEANFESLVAGINAKGRIPYLTSSDATSTTVGLAAMGAYGRRVLVEEVFWSHGMSGLGIQDRASTILIRLDRLVERIIASQLEHANTYRGQS